MTQLNSKTTYFLQRLAQTGPRRYGRIVPPLAELIEKGYCKVSPEHATEKSSGFWLPTGEMLLSITAAGRHVLELLDKDPGSLDADSSEEVAPLDTLA